ncbi:MAG: hypothetical protein ACLS6P_04620 [Clostridium paraputrificum]
MILDSTVFRTLHIPNIKLFLKNKSIDIDKKIKEYNIDTSSKAMYLQLINKLLEHNFLNEDDLSEFLINELNYGRAKNMYIEFITDIDELNLNEWIKKINFLQLKGYNINGSIANDYYLNGIEKYIDTGEKKLVFAKIDHDNNKVNCIRLLLGEGATLNNAGDKCNNYYSIEINLELMIIGIRIINWGDQLLPKYAPDKKFRDLFIDIKSVFLIKSHANLDYTQKLVYKLVNDLTGKVLNSTVGYVDSILKQEIEKKVDEWGLEVLKDGKGISKSDKDVICELILNNYYRVRMSKQYKRLTPKILINNFGVQAYPRQVKFIDDTIGEGKAKSSDPIESVLDTSVFYDIKARLDKEKNITNSIIYWIGCINENSFGTAIHVDNHDRFKVVFYPKYYFNKEKCDYVLCQIKKYS